MRAISFKHDCMKHNKMLQENKSHLKHEMEPFGARLSAQFVHEKLPNKPTNKLPKHSNQNPKKEQKSDFFPWIHGVDPWGYLADPYPMDLLQQKNSACRSFPCCRNLFLCFCLLILLH